MIAMRNRMLEWDAVMQRRRALGVLGKAMAALVLPSLSGCRSMSPPAGVDAPEPEWGRASERPGIVIREVSVPLANDSMPAYLAHPVDARRAPPVIVIHASWLVEPYIRDVTAMLAGAGFAALAVDLFHFYPRVHSWEEARRVPASVTAKLLEENFRERRLVADLGAAIAYLRQQPFVAPVGVGLVGFCGGGWNALLMAAQSEEIGAVVALYAPVAASDAQHRAPMALLPNIAAPVQYHQPEHDEWVSPADVDAFERGMRNASHVFERHVYPGAHHGFFAYDRDGTFDPASARLAWKRMAAFLAVHLRGAAPRHVLAPSASTGATTGAPHSGAALALHNHP